MPFLSCFRGIQEPSSQLTEPAKGHTPKRPHVDESNDNTSTADNGLLSLIHALSVLEGGWWSALHEACQATCGLLAADHACIYVLSPCDSWAVAAASWGVDVAAAAAAAGRVCPCDPRFNASAAAALLRAHKGLSAQRLTQQSTSLQEQPPGSSPPLPPASSFPSTAPYTQPTPTPTHALLFRDAASALPRRGRAGSSAGSSDSSGSGGAEWLPADWAALQDEAGCRQFAAVGCLAPGGGLVGVLSLASRAPTRPAAWRPEALHCAAGLLAAHIRRAAAALAAPPVSALAAAASFSDLVAAAAQAAADVAEAAGHVRGQSRVAFIRADLGTAAIFLQPSQPLPCARASASGRCGDADAAACVAPLPLLRARRSSCDYIVSNSTVGRRGSCLAATSIEAAAAAVQASLTGGGGAAPVIERTFPESARREFSGADRLMGAKLLSFTLSTGKGPTCKGHTLSLDRTLLDEALSKGVAGLCIDDCQAYTVGAKAYPRDLLLTRGSLLPASLALATLAHPEDGEPLMALYITYDTVLPRQLLAAVVAELEQLLRAIAPLVLSKLNGDLQREYDYLVWQLKEASSRKALARQAASGEQPHLQPQPQPGGEGAGSDKLGCAPAVTPGRPSAAGSVASDTHGLAGRSTPPGLPSGATSERPSQARGNDPSEPGAGGLLDVEITAAAVGAAAAADPLAAPAPAPLRVPLPRRMASLRYPGIPERAHSASDSMGVPNARILSSLPMRSVSFRLEAAQSPRGASKLAPLIASMHERLKAAQAAALTSRSAARKIDIQSLKLLQEIGRGGYGTVYRGTYHGAEVAVKLIAQSRLAASSGGGGPGGGGSNTSAALGLHKQHLHDAIELVASVSMSHTNIVQVPAYFLDVRVQKPSDPHNLLDSMDTPTESRPFRLMHSPSLIESPALALDTPGNIEWGGMALVLEFCDYGSLCDAIINRQFIERVTPKSTLPDAPAKTYLAINMRYVYMTLLEIALALRHMHGLALVHCDLKPQNVLLKSSPRDPRGFTAKLSDFGLAKLMAHDERGQLVIDEAVASGTITHVAPEVLLGQESLGAAVDIYAFGILMYQILCGTAVYDKAMSAAQIANAVANSGMRPRLPSWVPASYRSLAEACWQESPAARPTADELVRHLETALESRRQGQAQGGRDGGKDGGL